MGNLQLAAGSLVAERFEIAGPAGSGGMSTVYRARDRYSGEDVALKILRSSSDAAGDGERFAREARLLSELRHPGIVGYIAHGKTADGQRFLAMEWLKGQDLGQILRRKPLSVRDTMTLFRKVCEALAAAHQRGIIHRDARPSSTTGS